MPTDPTRKALEAAARALSDATLDWGDDPAEVWPGHRDQAAVVIAAYLRALGRDSEADRVQRAGESG